MCDLCLFPFGVYVFKRQKEEKGLLIFNQVFIKNGVKQNCRYRAHFFVFEKCGSFSRQYEKMVEWKNQAHC